MYLHAGKRINPNLKDDDFHVKLFQEKLKLRYGIPSHRNAMKSLLTQSSLDKIEDLPRGQILGAAIFDDTYWFDKTKHMDDPWHLGPFCYHVLDVVRFERGVEANGALSLWTPSPEAHHAIMAQPSVRAKFEAWKQQYGDQLYFGRGSNGIPSAITILQPFVEAMLRKLKMVENRKRPCFSLHDTVYKHPVTPPETQCRFCPDPSTSTTATSASPSSTSTSTTTAGGEGPSKPKCTHWIHVSDENSRKRPKTRRKLAPSQSDSSDEETESEEYYSSEEEGTYEYHTRSKGKKARDEKGDEDGDVAMKGNRKRKRHEVDTDDCDGDHMRSSKRRKRSKKERSLRREERKKRKEKRAQKKEETRKKYNDLYNDLTIGEDGVEPYRMCWHEQHKIMQPLHNPEEDPADCNVCGEEVSWDHYYRCFCDGIETAYCFHCCQEPRIASAESWKLVPALLGKFNESERKRVTETLEAPLEKLKRRRKKRKKERRKSKRSRRSKRSKAVGADGGEEKGDKEEKQQERGRQEDNKDCIVSGLLNMELPPIDFDASKMVLNLDGKIPLIPRSSASSQPLAPAPAQAPTAAASSAELQPIPLRQDVNSTEQQGVSGAAPSTKLDFSSFPQVLAVPQTNGNTPAAAPSTVAPTTSSSGNPSIQQLFPLSVGSTRTTHQAMNQQPVPIPNMALSNASLMNGARAMSNGHSGIGPSFPLALSSKPPPSKPATVPSPFVSPSPAIAINRSNNVVMNAFQSDSFLNCISNIKPRPSTLSLGLSSNAVPPRQQPSAMITNLQATVLQPITKLHAMSMPMTISNTVSNTMSNPAPITNPFGQAPVPQKEPSMGTNTNNGSSLNQTHCNNVPAISSNPMSNGVQGLNALNGVSTVNGVNILNGLNADDSSHPTVTTSSSTNGPLSNGHSNGHQVQSNGTHRNSEKQSQSHSATTSGTTSGSATIVHPVSSIWGNAGFDSSASSSQRTSQATSSSNSMKSSPHNMQQKMSAMQSQAIPNQLSFPLQSLQQKAPTATSGMPLNVSLQPVYQMQNFQNQNPNGYVNPFAFHSDLSNTAMAGHHGK